MLNRLTLVLLILAMYLTAGDGTDADTRPALPGSLVAPLLDQVVPR
jgi:hypothetical protein